MRSELHIEGVGEDCAEGGCDGSERSGLTGGEGDGGVRFCELGEDLSACAAGWAGGLVEVDDGHGGDPDGWAVEGDCLDQRGALGAEGEAVADVFDVCAGDDFAGGQKERGADAEAGVGRVGVGGDGGGGVNQRPHRDGDGLLGHFLGQLFPGLANGLEIQANPAAPALQNPRCNSSLSRPLR